MPQRPPWQPWAPDTCSVIPGSALETRCAAFAMVSPSSVTTSCHLVVIGCNKTTILGRAAGSPAEQREAASTTIASHQAAATQSAGDGRRRVICSSQQTDPTCPFSASTRHVKNLSMPPSLSLTLLTPHDAIAAFLTMSALVSSMPSAEPTVRSQARLSQSSSAASRDMSGGPLVGERCSFTSVCANKFYYGDRPRLA